MKVELIKNIMNTVCNLANVLKLPNKNSDVMAYFEAEYKNDPKGAYEYWRSTNKMTYSC